MFISKKKYLQLLDNYNKLEEIANRQQKLLVQINTELKHYEKLTSLYEACLHQGVKVDFPDVTGKGVNKSKGSTSVTTTTTYKY